MSKTKRFGEQVRLLRSALNLSQEQLASRLNVSFATVNRWESGKVEPQKAQLEGVEKLINDAVFERFFTAVPLQLEQQAFAKITGSNSRRMKGLDHFKNFQNLLWRDIGGKSQFLDAAL